MRVQPGCYLLKAPRCVGADGRAFREHADAKRVPALVLVHEPETRTKEWPIVAIGPVTPTWTNGSMNSYTPM